MNSKQTTYPKRSGIDSNQENLTVLSYISLGICAEDHTSHFSHADQFRGRCTRHVYESRNKDTFPKQLQLCLAIGNPRYLAFKMFMIGFEVRVVSQWMMTPS